MTAAATTIASQLSHDDLRDLSAIVHYDDAPPSARRAAQRVLEMAARDSLLAYAYACPTDAPFVGGWHHEVICRRLEEAIRTPGSRTMVCAPPRHGKTRLVSHIAPAWTLGVSPSEHIIACSYAAQLAQSNSRQAQRVIDSEPHRRAFPDATLGVRNVRSVSGAPLRNVDEWELVDRGGERTGGRYYCAGVGGGITGRGWSLGVIDDPLRGAKDADSALIRSRQWEWYRSEFLTRALGRRARQLMILTRWHEDDLAGRCIETDGLIDEGGRWRVLRLPAIMDDLSTADPDDPRAEGEPLWPGEPFGFDAEYFETLRGGIDGTSLRTWEALYQQRPRPAEGAIWRSDYLRTYTVVPSPSHSPRIHDGDREIDVLSLQYRYLTVDVALGYRDGDWTVVMCWGFDAQTDRVYLLDMRRERLGAPETLDLIRRWLTESPYRPQRAYVENVQYQAALIQNARREGLPVDPLTPDRDKAARMREVEHIGEQGRAYHRYDAPWRRPLERELLAFRGHPDDIDDQVDAFVYGLRVAVGHARGARRPPQGVPAVRRRDWLG